MKQTVSRGHTRPLTEISFVEDGDRTLLVSSAHDKVPQIRNGETGDWIGTFHGHKGAVWSSKVDSKTRTLAATASGDFTAKLWCATTGNELYEFKHRHVVKCVDFSANSERIATGCQDGLMRIYDICRPEAAPQEFRLAATGIAEAISKVCWSPTEENMLIVGKRNGLLEKWDSRLGDKNGPAQIATIQGGDNVMDLEISSNHGIILVAAGKKVCSYEMNSMQLLKTFDMPDKLTFHEEGGASLNRSGETFICGGSDLWLREFDYNTGEVLRTLKGHHGPIRCVRWHPWGTIGASGSEDGTIRLWDFESAPVNGKE